MSTSVNGEAVTINASDIELTNALGTAVPTGTAGTEA